MVTVSASNDGFVVRDYNVAAQDPTSLGEYHTKSGSASGTAAEVNAIICGYFQAPTKRYDASFTFNNLQIAKGSTVKSAVLRLYVQRCYATFMFNVYIGKNPKDLIPGPSNDPTFKNSSLYDLGDSIKFFNGNSNPNIVPYFYWNWNAAYIDIDVSAHLRELIGQSNYAIGDRANFFVRPAKISKNTTDNFDEGDNEGYIAFKAVESGTKAQLIYEVAAPVELPTITSVSGDNEIKAGETNVVIAGTNLGNTNIVRLISGTATYQQTLTFKSATELRFNLSNVPSNSAYTLTITTATGATASKDVTVRDELGTVIPTPETPADPEVPAENVTSATVYTSKDGHEYDTTTSYASGIWENSASVTSCTQYLSEYDRLFVGTWNGFTFKAHMKLGPFNIAKGATISLARLDLKIDTHYKKNNFIVRAVANPQAPDLGVGNDITAQTLTTASVSNSTEAWTNYNGTDFWKQTPNPYPLNVTPIVQEMVNKANWTSGSYINFVIDYVPDPSQQGHTRFYSNDSSANKASSLYFIVNNGTEITSVSNDNILEIGEKNATIIGFNLTGATNLRITKGATNVAQTIKSVTDTTVIFDVTTGAIVPGTGYTVSLDVGGKTYSKTVEFVTGGGVNSGTVGGSADGHESDDNQFSEEYSPKHLIWIGRPPLGNGKEYTATLRVGPINAQKGQTITSATLTWNQPPSVPDNAYKFFEMLIKAIKDPTVAELGPSNLISANAKTTAEQLVYIYEAFPTMNDSDYWQTTSETFDIANIIQEMVNHDKWVTGSFVQLVFIPYIYPAGDAFISFGSIEGGYSPTFSYETGTATSIANVNGTNIIRVGDKDVRIVGNELGDIDSIIIRNNNVEVEQDLTRGDDENLFFDFVQGDMAYGPSKIILKEGTKSYVFDVQLEPNLDYKYVILTSASKGNGSLTYADVPALVKGDIIEYQKTSNNGFAVEVLPDGTPTIKNGNGSDAFLVRGYQVSQKTWYDYQTVNFYDSGYLNINVVPMLEFSQVVGAISITVEPEEPTTPPVDPEPVIKPVITSVNGGNTILPNQQNIIIRGTNLSSVYILRLVGISNVYYQSMTTIQNSEIRFNLNADVPDNAYYVLELITRSNQKAGVQVLVKSTVTTPVDPTDPVDPNPPVDPEPPIPPVIVDPVKYEVWEIQNDTDDKETWQ